MSCVSVLNTFTHDAFSRLKSGMHRSLFHIFLIPVFLRHLLTTAVLGGRRTHSGSGHDGGPCGGCEMGPRPRLGWEKTFDLSVLRMSRHSVGLSFLQRSGRRNTASRRSPSVSVASEVGQPEQAWPSLCPVGLSREALSRARPGATVAGVSEV